MAVHAELLKRLQSTSRLLLKLQETFLSMVVCCVVSATAVLLTPHATDCCPARLAVLLLLQG
jgi:hypothetical protein